MKKKMKAIFIISVLFIICVGLFGIMSGRHRSGGSLSYYNLLSEDSATQEIKKEKQISTNDNEDDINNTNNTEQISDSIEEIKEKVAEENTEKEQYIERLDSIVSYYDDLWSKSDSLDMAGMKELKNQEYTKWDDELNTIYQMIKKKLPEDEFTLLRAEERKWITTRDEQAASAASEYAGGTMEGLAYMSSMTDTTRERTYELVEIYFQE